MRLDISAGPPSANAVMQTEMNTGSAIRLKRMLSGLEIFQSSVVRPFLTSTRPILKLAKEFGKNIGSHQERVE